MCAADEPLLAGERDRQHDSSRQLLSESGKGEEMGSGTRAGRQFGRFYPNRGRGPAEERAARVASDMGRSGGRGIGEGGGTLGSHA